jgi:F-type H+-transporting ATPase subunit b
MLEAETWVAVAFFIFVGVLAYLRVHKTIVGSLDQRGARIKAEIDEARRLKIEAEALLAESKRKLTEADREAESLVAGARAEAERLALEAKAKLEELVSRRTKIAEAKIAQAEAQALADVRGRDDPHPDGQGKACRGPDRQGRRRAQDEAQLARRSPDEAIAMQSIAIAQSGADTPVGARQMRTIKVSDVGSRAERSR